MFSYSELGSDPPIGSDREAGRDKCGLISLIPLKVMFGSFIKSHFSFFFLN